MLNPVHFIVQVPGAKLRIRPRLFFHVAYVIVLPRSRMIERIGDLYPTVAVVVIENGVRALKQSSRLPFRLGYGDLVAHFIVGKSGGSLIACSRPRRCLNHPEIAVVIMYNLL